MCWMKADDDRRLDNSSGKIAQLNYSMFDNFYDIQQKLAFIGDFDETQALKSQLLVAKALFSNAFLSELGRTST